MHFWISAFLVAFGQNAWLSFCGPLAASIGFALHWKKRSSSKISFLWFFLIQLVQLSWLTDRTYQGLYIIFVYLVLCAAMALQFALLSAFVKKQDRLTWQVILGFAAFWTLMEWIRFYILCGFPFNIVGLYLTCSSYSRQFASVFGVLGLSFWVIMTNGLALKYFRDWKCLKKFLQWAVVAFIPYLWGSISLFFPVEAKDSCLALLIQTGLLPSQKYKVYGRENEYMHPVQQWENILEEIALYKEKEVQLIALPEAAIPFGVDRYIYDRVWIQKLLTHALGSKVEEAFPKDEAPFGNGIYVSNSYIIQTIADFFDAQVIVGLDRETSLNNYNSVLSFERDSLPEVYDKRVLIPLVEYIPFPFLKKYSEAYGITGFFSPGAEGRVLGKYRIFPSVCYEELFPHLIRESKKRGANLLVNVSNDGWFPFSRLAEQHFSQAMLRSIENGIPLLHVSAMGVTAIVNPTGEVTHQVIGEKRGSVYARVPIYQAKTLFSLTGEVPLLIVCGVLTLGLYKKRNDLKKLAPV